MRSSKITYFAVVVALLATIFPFSVHTEDLVLAKKTLKRWVDPVIMEGKLAGEMLGEPVANLRLYAYKDGSLEPIRFQIDEMSPDSDWILPDGPIPNKDLSNAKFDPLDKILFMTDDTGDRISRETWASGYTKGTEIEVIDPISGEAGWCYILYFSSNPPPKSQKPAYITYDYDKELLVSDYIHEKFIITKDDLHTTYYEAYSIPEKAGGSGKNFVDRLKVRVTIKLLLSTVTVQLNEEQLKSNVLAYKAGPIRINRRTEQYYKGPGGVKILRAVVDDAEYRNFSSVPTIIDVPFRLDRIVSSFIIRIGTDYNKNTYGARIYNSNNLKGFLVNGKMDDGEENFNPGVDKWRLITGEMGTFMSRTIFTPEILEHVKITMGLIDDVNQIFPPESDPGSVGFLWQDWGVGDVPKGKYFLFLEFYQPPYFKVGDEVQYTNYQDHLLKIRVGDQEEKSQPLVLPSLGKRYK